ncbi:MAG: class I SAM-dependent methyltransferase [Candidatus Kapaibacterium sp.]
MHTSATERFTSRVDAYRKYRPHYPSAVIQALHGHTGLRVSHIIADVGSGTGISSELFLDNGNFVYGIEPNKAMREAGEEYLSTYKNFRSVVGTAEETTLPDRSVDYIVAGQAFHWFDVARAEKEFNRILKSGGWTVILWNDREFDTTPFLRDYEQLLLDFGTDYVQVNHRNVVITSSAHDRSCAPDTNISSSNAKRTIDFFHGRPVLKLKFDNNQMLDYESLEGRLLSSSYLPDREAPNYNAMLARLRELFDRHAVNDRIEMRYQTLLYAGQFSTTGN